MKLRNLFRGTPVTPARPLTWRRGGLCPECRQATVIPMLEGRLTCIKCGAQDPAFTPLPDPQCSKTTGKGTRCKLPARDDGLCAMHGAK